MLSKKKYRPLKNNNKGIANKISAYDYVGFTRHNRFLLICLFPIIKKKVFIAHSNGVHFLSFESSILYKSSGVKNPISYDRRGKAEEKRRGCMTVWDKPYLSVLESGSGCHYSCLCGTSIQCHLYQPFIILSTPSYRFCPHSQVHTTCRNPEVFLSGSFPTQLSTVQPVQSLSLHHLTQLHKSTLVSSEWLLSLLYLRRFKPPETWPLPGSALVTPVLH